MEPYGDSESESEEESEAELVTALARPGRFSGTGSTHSTHSNQSHNSRDSGISEEESGLQGGGREPGKARPESCVPSEFSEASYISEAEIVSDDIKACRVGSEETVEEPADCVAEQNNRIRKAYSIASELLKTEINYVAVLHLIAQVGPVRPWNNS